MEKTRETILRNSMMDADVITLVLRPVQKLLNSGQNSQWNSLFQIDVTSIIYSVTKDIANLLVFEAKFDNLITFNKAGINI